MPTKTAARALLIMAREPRPGTVKTRLQPVLSAVQAAQLYAAFLRDVLAASRALPVSRYLLVDPPTAVPALTAQVAGDFTVLAQQGADLAERMVAGFAQAFAAGHRHVVMRNSDSPALPSARVEQAFAALAAGADLVLGPDQGGGYYLVGLQAPCPELFRGVPMSTVSMRQQTLELARRRGLETRELEPELDVDEPGDLARLWKDLADVEVARRCPATRGYLGELVRSSQLGATLR